MKEALGEQFGLEKEPEERKFHEVVQQKVDSLAANKREVAGVDVKAYDEGMAAFKKGDREKVVENIAELQSQEAKLKDRWDLLLQTRSQMMSADNHESLFSDRGGFFGFLGGDGGRRLADQTEKLSDVRGELLKAGNEVQARRALLEYALKRMDSVVPADTSAPRRVAVLGQAPDRMRGKMDLDIDNPLGVGKVENPLSPRRVQNPLDPMTVKNPVV